jgi:hypothetical protein
MIVREKPGAALTFCGVARESRGFITMAAVVAVVSLRKFLREGIDGIYYMFFKIIAE